MNCYEFIKNEFIKNEFTKNEFTKNEFIKNEFIKNEYELNYEFTLCWLHECENENEFISFFLVSSYFCPVL